jgi:hypothetical protein
MAKFKVGDILKSIDDTTGWSRVKLLPNGIEVLGLNGSHDNTYVGEIRIGYPPHTFEKSGYWVLDEAAIVDGVLGKYLPGYNQDSSDTKGYMD